MRIVVSYDISDNKRRNKVARLMEGHGYRVQYSVFECDLTKRQLAALKKQLKPLVNAREWESVRFYPLCADCQENISVLGKDMARYLEAITII